jgi:hypothetical protein
MWQQNYKFTWCFVWAWNLSLSQREEPSFMALQNTVLSRTYGPKWQKVTAATYLNPVPRSRMCGAIYLFPPSPLPICQHGVELCEVPGTTTLPWYEMQTNGRESRCEINKAVLFPYRGHGYDSHCIVRVPFHRQEFDHSNSSVHIAHDHSSLTEHRIRNLHVCLANTGLRYTAFDWQEWFQEICWTFLRALPRQQNCMKELKWQTTYKYQ